MTHDEFKAWAAANLQEQKGHIPLTGGAMHKCLAEARILSGASSWVRIWCTPHLPDGCGVSPEHTPDNSWVLSMNDFASLRGYAIDEEEEMASQTTRDLMTPTREG